MQIGEQEVMGLEQGDFGGLRFLDFHDQLGSGEDRFRPVHQLRADGLIERVREACTGAGTPLDEDPIAAFHQFRHRARGHAHPVFLRLDFLGNANVHGGTLARLRGASNCGDGNVEAVPLLQRAWCRRESIGLPVSGALGSTAGTTSGSRKLKVLPRPGAEATVIELPMASARRCEIARPRPVP